MPHPRIRLSTAGNQSDVQAGLDRIRAELRVPDTFPIPVLAEAARVAHAGPPAAEQDLTDVPFFTIDPPGSMDLDQAMYLERRPGGHRIRYAIADVAAFVRPGGAIDQEAHVRGATQYLPDARAPLHPPELSEGAASLLPGQERAAVVWTIDLDEAGEIAGVDVRRALVRSRERLDYDNAQKAVETDERLVLLGEIGRLLLDAEAARGGVSLPLPEQEVTRAADGWSLEFRGGLPSEQWNAQISLVTGRAAAQMMLAGRIGLLRTMPPAPEAALARLRRTAAALGIDWPRDTTYGSVVRSLDPALPRHAAFLHAAAGLMRGAGYTAFDGAVPEQPVHAAVAAPYAHVTAPLRRLADRYATEACLAITAGEPVPGWVRDGLADLPKAMERGLRRAADVDRACIDLVEAIVLRDRVGDLFDAVVVDVSPTKPAATVQLLDPAVQAQCDGALPLGEPVKVRLTEADPATRHVRFALAPR
jgi:exoribonuclease R